MGGKKKGRKQKTLRKMRGLAVAPFLVLSLGLVNGRAVQDEAETKEVIVEKGDSEGEEEVATKAPYVPGGDKTPFLRGGPGGQGGHFNPHIPDFVPDPSVTNPGGQGYNPGNNGGQGYNPGYNGGQGYNPGNNGGQGYNPGHNGGQGYNPGNNGGQGYNPGHNGGQGYNPGGYNPGGRNGDEIQFPGAGNGIGGRSQFRTPIVFADDEDTSEEGSKATFQPVGALGGPQLSVKTQGSPEGVQTLPGFPSRRFPVRRPYVPGQDKKPLLRGKEVFVQQPGSPGGPWDGTTLALLLQPKDFNPAIQTGSVQTLPSPIQFAETPQFRKLRPSPVQDQFNPQIQSGLVQTLPTTIQLAGAQFNPQIQSGFAQTLPSPIQFAEEEPKVLLLQLASEPQSEGRTPGLQPLPSPIQFASSTRQEYVPGGNKTPFLRPASSKVPQIEAGVAQTLPSGIQFAEDARPYIGGSDKGPYLRPQQQPKVIVVSGKADSREGFVNAYQGLPYPPYIQRSATPPSPTIIYIF